MHTHNSLDHKLILLSIKYAPSILALTCSVKIWMLTMCDHDKCQWLYLVNWINVVFNLIILGVVYVMGRFYGFCWKHRSLCRFALWGYIYYIFFLIDRTPKSFTMPLALMYVAIVLVFSALYKRI